MTDRLERLQTRFLVVGTGVAGLHTAWRAAQGVAGDGDVLLLTKRTLFDSATAYAQGGIAAALGAGDSPALHRADTLAAGAALCDADAVQVLVEEGPSRVRELQTAGAAFDLTPAGEIKLGREAAHSVDRIVHARGDQTGAEVARTLVERVRGERRLRVLEQARVLDLVVADEPGGRRVLGARASVAGQPVEILADATVLATGGCGQVYRYTTNPLVATGDGYAIAHRAGARLADLEFVQFHPTALDTAENPLALVSEAVRGEGAILLNAQQERFMPARHPLAELAPRDVVAREIFREQQRTGRVWLDARALKDGVRFSERFPGIYALCTARDIDPERELIPVTPAAHYMMGGVVTDLAGRASLAGLWAVGEVARLRAAAARAVAPRRAGAAAPAGAGDHDHLGLMLALPQLGEERHAVELGHVLVGEHHGVLVAPGGGEQVERLLAVDRAVDLEPLGFENRGERDDRLLLVVGDEEFGRHDRRITDTGTTRRCAEQRPNWTETPQTAQRVPRRVPRPPRA